MLARSRAAAFVTLLPVDVTALDGRTFERFVAAGTYFLRKYRAVLNDLNVFPVPDGDTGSNMYHTARAALTEVVRKRGEPLSSVAAAAAAGSLLGARGNSGVIFSQMLRGFAHNVRHRPKVDSLDLALAMREAVGSARSALQNPVEGTMITVAGAAAEAALSSAQRETDLVRVAGEIVRAAADALERTPDQLPALREAGVVDSGGAGIVYFLEGILRFLPEATTRATAFPRRPQRRRTFSARQTITQHRFCTEFVLEDATVDAHALRDLLEPCGESLIVAGSAPTFKVHVHAAEPQAVFAMVRRVGRVARDKVEDMALQHHLLVVDAPKKPFGVVAVVQGDGFARIARELGADVVVASPNNPSVKELVVAVNACLASVVMLLVNDADVVFAAREAAALSQRDVIVVPTRDVPSGLAALLALGGAEHAPSAEELLQRVAVAVATVFFAGRDTLLDRALLRRGAPAAALNGRLLRGETLTDTVLLAATELCAAEGGLLTLYYGGAQKERDAHAMAQTLSATFPAASVEWYYGGQPANEYVISREL
ncbi:MAG: DAK2 domain-containing protein [Candidatus Eremiobacteraeota bacterium]|nr:DAK2 domain-containing protein [Candidatus Eremiobacteraeota bacterium]